MKCVPIGEILFMFFSGINMKNRYKIVRVLCAKNFLCQKYVVFLITDF